MPHIIHPESLPILTEKVDSTPLVLPILTEAVKGQTAITAKKLPLSDEQCHQLAELLLPQIEATLLDAISSSPEADWQTAIQQVHGRLPELIRKGIQEFR